MNTTTNIKELARELTLDPIEAAIMDVARALQITQTMHQEAESHYRGLASHVDRAGSPFEDKVDEIYSSGSFAIHAATRSNIKQDQHDVDAVLELNCAVDSNPEWVLDELYKAIRGEPGSKYFDYSIEKNSRCVTVTYPGGVTVDLMPVVRLEGMPERVAVLFHHKGEAGESYQKEINPKGFADYFNRHIKTNQTFQNRFDARRFMVDGETYSESVNRMVANSIVVEKADTQPMPDHIPLDQKSTRVVALQLIKRFRDIRFRKHDNHRGKRKPPSIIIAAISLNAGPENDNLIDEVIAISRYMRTVIHNAEDCQNLLDVRNPVHHNDVFTDRWPEARNDQQLWASDLETLIERLETLQGIEFEPAPIQSILTDLFGEKAGETALQAYHQAQTNSLEHGTLGMTRHGRFKLATPASKRSTPALIAEVPSTLLIMPARGNTNMGGSIPDDHS